MLFEYQIDLYEKPARELPLEEDSCGGLIPNDLRIHGEELESRLYEAADTMEAFQEKGWGLYGTTYSIFMIKEFETEEDAEVEVEDLGYPLYLLYLVEGDDNYKNGVCSCCCDSCSVTEH